MNFNKETTGGAIPPEKGEIMTSDAQKRATEKYDAANTVQFHLKLNINTDQDIIDKLNSVESKQGYIKYLIREDLKKGVAGGVADKCMKRYIFDEK